MTWKLFNKKNVKKFAKSLYCEKDGDIYYRPMCNGALAKANGELVGCILAELYEEFEGKALARSISEEESKKLWKGPTSYNYKINIGNGEFLHVKHSVVLKGINNAAPIDEPFIIKNLVNKSVLNTNATDLKRTCCRSKVTEKLLAKKLDALVTINDRIKGETEEARIKRAQRVQKKLFEIADKFLA